MPRQYIVNSWVGAAEYDEGDTYNGQQIGNRNQKSIGVHITRSGDNWYANTKAYSETEPKPLRKPKVKRSAFDQVCLADSRYNRLQSLLEALEQEHEDGKISWEDFIYARKQLEPRLERAWRQISKYRDWREDEEEDYSLSETPQNAIENTHKNDVEGVAHTSTWVDTLSHENMFKKPIEKALHAAHMLVSWHQKLKSHRNR